MRTSGKFGTYSRGLCRTCGKAFPVRNNGRPWAHDVYFSGHWTRCPGVNLDALDRVLGAGEQEGETP